MGKDQKSKFVALDWKPLQPNPALFQIPKKSQDKPLVKIMNPLDQTLPAANPPSSGIPTHQSTVRPAENRIGSVDDVWAASEEHRVGETVHDSFKTLPYRTGITGRSGGAQEKSSNNAKIPADALPENYRSNWTPDVYAHAFVPEALWKINQSPATLISSPALEGTNFSKFVSRFAGSQFLSALQPPPYPHLSGNDPPISLDRLNVDKYRQYFTDCLILDLEAQIPRTRAYDLFGVPLTVVDKTQQLFQLHVPGLIEGTPSVNIGDAIMLRQLIIDPVTSLPRGMSAWLAPGGGFARHEVAPGFTGYQVSAVVMRVDKSREFLILRAQGLVIAPGMLACNVTFVVQARLIQSLQRAVIDIGKELACDGDFMQDVHEIQDQKIFPFKETNLSGQVDSPSIDFGAVGTPSRMKQRSLSTVSSQSQISKNKPEHLVPNTNNWLRSVLFPTEENGVQQKTLPSAVFSQLWVDRSLNYEQKKAVNAVQSRNYGNLCFLLNGPPGTGKTKTICETVAQMVKDTDLMGCILLCAPSNPAADTLALRLRAWFEPKTLLRLNDFSRTFAEVPQELLPYCFVEEDMFNLPPLEALMAYKIVVPTCRDADMLVQARVTNRDLFSLQTNLTRSIHPNISDGDLPQSNKMLHWSALLVDEAAQATEPETLIPLTVIAPPSRYTGRLSPIFVMAGDEHQLNPRTYDRSSTIHVSLFERLSKRPLYASHPLARTRLHLANQRFPMLRPSFVNLTRNYRSHPAILAIPSSLFYADTLIPEATPSDSLQSWDGWRGRAWPVLFSCNGGAEDCEDIHGVGGGWYNVREALKAIHYAQHLLNSGCITNQKDICIMSSFRAQVNFLRRKARENGLYGLNIGPSDAFQGLESRFVIICTTRARRRFLKDDMSKGVGIVDERKKFNVAVTRAKEGLIVIGNPKLLAIDQYWSAFMAFCWRNGLWQRENENDNEMDSEDGKVNEWSPPRAVGQHDGHGLARLPGLESALIYKERNKHVGSEAAMRFMNGGESNEEALWRTAMEAEEFVRKSELQSMSEYVGNEGNGNDE